MRSELIAEMKKVFGEDRARIDHALAVLSHAESIQRHEGGNPEVVTAAAILHDIGIQEAERKYGSSAGKYQEIESPPIARNILSQFISDESVLEHVLAIIGNHHSARDIDTLEFRVVWDADWLVNIGADHSDAGPEEIKKLIKRVFKTRKGHQKAVTMFLKIENGL